jgi:ketosteroid isomerase-like protein
MDAIKAICRDIYRNYALAWETGNADLWLSIWDEGGTQMPPEFPSRTKGDLREIMPLRFVPNMVSSFDIELDEINVLGDFAVARGLYTCDYTEEYAQPQTDGKFLSILKRQKDDTWKFHIDCFNSNLDPAYTS